VRPKAAKTWSNVFRSSGVGGRERGDAGAPAAAAHSSRHRRSASERAMPSRRARALSARTWRWESLTATSVSFGSSVGRPPATSYVIHKYSASAKSPHAAVPSRFRSWRCARNWLGALRRSPERTLLAKTDRHGNRDRNRDLMWRRGRPPRAPSRGESNDTRTAPRPALRLARRLRASRARDRARDASAVTGAPFVPVQEPLAAAAHELCYT